ncbi:MAG: hypothetical protein AMXMBFR58_13500 [Phycisphaerae bacterium]|nr:hypothetical protein [Phycisphaerales bacterium]
MTATATGASAAVKATTTTDARPSKVADPLDVEHLLDDLFITPRVVDRRGFEELAGLLKQLVRDAAAKGDSLRGAAAEVRVLGDSLREATRQLQVRLEAALKVAPALDQRVAKAEQVVQLAIDRSALADQLESSLSRIIETRLAEYGRRLEELNARHSEDLRAAAGRVIDDLEARRERLVGQTIDAANQADAARTRLAAELETFQHMLRTQVDAAAERLADPIRQADRAAAELAGRALRDVADARQKLDEARNEADIKLAGLVETISRHADTVARRAQEQCGATELHAREILDRAAIRLDELRDQSEHITASASQSVERAREDADRQCEAKVENAASAAAEQVSVAGARIAAQLVEVGRATLDAGQEAQKVIREHAARAVENMQESAAALDARLDAARRLLNDLPAMIDQQLARLGASSTNEKDFPAGGRRGTSVGMDEAAV